MSTPTADGNGARPRTRLDVLRDLGAARDLYGTAKRARVELVIEANAAGITHRRIAEVLNVSPGWVHRTLQRAQRGGA